MTGTSPAKVGTCEREAGTFPVASSACDFGETAGESGAGACEGAKTEGDFPAGTCGSEGDAGASGTGTSGNDARGGESQAGDGRGGKPDCGISAVMEEGGGGVRMEADFHGPQCWPIQQAGAERCNAGLSPNFFGAITGGDSEMEPALCG